MSLISLVQVRHRIGTKELFEGLSFGIGALDRVGLVGLNGSGKSTLLKILSGQIEPEEGRVVRARSLAVEYVPQTLPVHLRAVTVFDAVAEKLPGGYLGAASDYLVERSLDEARISEDLYFRPLGELSGGEVNRALFARTRVAEPNLILLDEPTNHLDEASIIEFERCMRQDLDCAFVIISHDRMLLDAVTERTLFLRDRRLWSFDLPYSAAREELEVADRAAEARRKAEDKEIARVRTSAARLAEWGRAFDNEDLARKAKTMERRAEKLEQQRTFVTEKVRTRLALATEESRPQVLVHANTLSVSSEAGRALFSMDRFELRRGERLALLGPNGCGKSTFLRRLVAAWHAPGTDPVIRVNPSTKLGYYDQDLRHLNDDERILSAVADRCALSSSALVPELVNAGFPYERQKERIRGLSGGEKARLSFLILKLLRPHVAILDEPTNHIDVRGIEELEAQLIASDSTCLFVSHDRRFIERVATRVIRISANGEVTR